ncbi:MAG: PstS family phosphate ABC transporter substrate-binding protein [Flavisolibacter sp.]
MRDRFDRGTIQVSCDETFKPVVDQLVMVYESQYPDTKINVHYKPEAECLNDLLDSSIRMVIATRGYSASEQKMIIDSLDTDPQQMVVARDLVTVLVHPSMPDPFFSMTELKDLLSGRSKENLVPVFDGNRATSTVRFMIDSVLKGDSLGKNVVAAKNSVDVIDYVSRVPKAVGFVGFSWIGNMDDTAQVTARKKIRIAYIESTDSAGAYVQPSQYFIYTKSYPLVRDLVYVLKERHQGLGHAFASFMEGDRGQLIFRRSYLMPVLKPNYIRNTKINEKLTTGK